jgi:hypothetical protein
MLKTVTREAVIVEEIPVAVTLCTHSQGLAGVRTRNSAENTREPGCTTFKKISSHLKTSGARRVTCNRFHTDSPQILGATEQNLVAIAIWRPGFVQLRVTKPGTFRIQFSNQLYLTPYLEILN